MKNCTDCKWALWDTTATGRLHPAGGGFCKYPYKVPALPQQLRQAPGVLPVHIPRLSARHIPRPDGQAHDFALRRHGSRRVAPVARHRGSEKRGTELAFRNRAVA